MNVLRFQARNSAEAIRQIHSQLGAEAVVLSVTRLPLKGLGRLWRRPGLEVLAGLPEKPEPETKSQELEASHQSEGQGHPMPSCIVQSLQADRSHHAAGTTQHAPELTPEAESEPAVLPAPARFAFREAAFMPQVSGWRTPAVLRQMGLQPLCVDQVLDRVRASCGEQPPESFAEEFELVRLALSSLWRTPAPLEHKNSPPIHVFIGPPGSGKTTVLCKWLAQSVLVQSQTPRTWRLDSRAANFAGLLDFYSEILGVRLEREWSGVPAMPGFDLGFIDLPGTNPQDLLALQQLGVRLQAIPEVQVHLVLNAAYDTHVLLAHVRAFATLPVSDLILTHLDEEKRHGKLWNLVLGTNLPVRFLSGGQNIPGDFRPATPELLFSR